MNKFNISGGFKRGAVLVFAACAGISMMGCDRKSNSDDTSQYSVPAGLKDCQIYRLNSYTRSDLVVVRCPNSNTSATFKSGKTDAHVSTVESDAPVTPLPPETVTVDGKTYKLER
jgi:hypothetical protein